ncbi:MAG: sugar ABC transporter permease [Sinimarinibacterium sp.]|jgi:arabinogalactan oligomer/maltooligosaccharide transport system permease protein
MTPRSLLAQPVALGLVLGALAAALLSEWFFMQARDELLADRQQRAVVMQAMALGDQVAAAEAGEASEAGVDRLAGVVQHWSQRFADIASIRIVRSADATLLASTDANDAGPFPRRLAREEKALYDLGQTLRANAETNAAEGVFRKKQLDVVRLDRTRLRVAAPYTVDGEVRGFAQVQQGVPAAPIRPDLGRAALVIGLPVVVFALAMMAWRRRGARAPPAVELGLAAVLLAGALYGQSTAGLRELADRHQAYAAELAQTYNAIRQAFDATASLTGAVAGGDNRWDVDEYLRPLGVIGGDGSLQRAALDATLDIRENHLRRSLWSAAVLGAGLLAFIGLGYGRRLRQTLVEHRIAYGYVTPAIAGMLVLVFFPFVYGVTLSFTDTTLFNENLSLRELWIGLKNYAVILGDFHVVRGTDGDWVVNYQNFYWTLFITVMWTVCNVAIGVSVGLVLALALNTKGLRFSNVYRVLLILPWAIPNYITALTWRGMFHKQYGVINQMIQIFGGEPVSWFDTAFTSFLTGIVTNGWLSFPFMMVITLGGLQSIPQSAYEAAYVEGATRWQQFRHITLPYLKPTLIPAIIISVVWTFNMFNIIYLVSGGEPAGSNEILITQAYKIAFEKYQYGYAAAYSVVIFMLLLVYGVFQNRVTRATEAIA